MPLYKLRIEAADLEAGARASALLGEPPAPVALAVTLFELAPPAFVVEAYYDEAPPLEAIAAALGPETAKLGRPVVDLVPDTNWVALSQAALPPIRAGRFVVHGAHDRGRFAMHRFAIEIEAGEAFGTGHNATTVLCLEALDGLAQHNRVARVLDLGTGSGVLAIAAARVWPAAQVLASDNDPVAADIARDNVRLNRVQHRVRVVMAPGFAHARLRAPRFDLVMSNLLPGPLLALAPAMVRALAPGGFVVLSGLLTHQVREVVGTYRAHGFRLVRHAESSGWTALTLVRITAPAAAVCRR